MFGIFWLIGITVICYLSMQKSVSQNQSDIFILPTKKPVKPLKIMGWIPYWDQPGAYQSFTEHAKSFESIGLFWYYLKPDGTIGRYRNAVFDQSIIETAHANNVKVMLVLTNMPDHTETNTDWDWQRVDRVISTAKARASHVSEIVSLVTDKGFDGLDLDYEALRGQQRDDLSTFIHSLALALHEKQKILGIAIHPKTSENNPDEDNGSRAQDWASIARDADRMYFMTYTERYKGSSPGSSGSLPWIKQVLNYAVKTVKVPPEKIFLGIGLFGMEWIESGQGQYRGIADDLTYAQVQSVISSFDAKPAWDEYVGSNRLEYLKNSTKHIIWFDDARSLVIRSGIAKNNAFAGIALWRLGGEDENIWQQTAWRR